MAAMNLSRFGASVLLALAMVRLSAAFLTPSNRIHLQPHARQQAQVTMAAAASTKFQWIKVLPLSDAPAPGTTKSVFVADLDLCVAADDGGLLYVVGNKCPPANQPLSFSSVVNKCVKDPVLGTKIDLETGGIVDWCPSLLGKLLSPLVGPEPEDGGVPAYKVRSTGGNLEAYLDVTAKSEFEKNYWKGILDAKGKADGEYY